MAITPPNNLSASAASSNKINLSWSNPQVYIAIEVQRSPNGSTGWGVIGTLGGTDTSFSDNNCQDGTRYYYRLEVTDNSEDSDYSNTADAISLLDAPGSLSGTSDNDGTKCILTWDDNCQNETGFKVYKAGVLLATLGANVTTYTATGLTAGASYSFYVTAYNALITSPASNTVTVVMEDPPAAPRNLVAVATSTTTVQLNWSDIAKNELRYYIELSSTSGTAGFSVYGTYLGPNVTSLQVASLTTNTQYWFRVRAWNKSGYSAYCAVATATTWAAIAQPTNLVVAAASETAVDLYFDDNSELEDGHSIEMKVGGGAYAEIVVLEPNRYSYRKTGLTKGTTYTFKVRAVQGVSYSAYSDEVAVTTPTNVSAPANLAVSEYQDTWVKLTWDHVAAADAYQVKVSTDDITFTSAGIVFTPNTHELKVTGLTAGTLYYFNCAAKSVAGWSADSASISQTTRTSYSFSAFQRLIRRSSPNLIYLVELNPAMVLEGWSLSSGKSYTYEMAFDERGAEIETVEENGEALTEQSSLADVESNAGSWWHDLESKKVYVHTSGSDATSNYVLIGTFWLYYTTKSRENALTVFNDNCYLPIVADIPDITQEIAPYYESNFVITHGSISFANKQIAGVNYWDDKFSKYLFTNRQARVLAGGDGFSYADFSVIDTGIIESYDCNDQRLTINLRDRRDGLHRSIPTAMYDLDEFPDMDEDAVGQVKPFGYGVITNAVPIRIDTTNKIFEFHNGRCTSVEEVRQNGAVLTPDTDYFVDYHRGRIILARGGAYDVDDEILVDFTGQAFNEGTSISRGADIFRDIMTRFLGMTDNDLDLESLALLRQSNTTGLSLYIWQETDSQELIRRIERSVLAYTFQSADGKLGMKAALTSAPSDISYIPDVHVVDFAMSRDKQSLYSSVNVYYGENPSTEKYLLQQCENTQLTYRHRVNQVLDVYTALTSAADAVLLGSDIIGLLDRVHISFTVPRCLFTHHPGDLIYFSRGRYYGSDPTASNKLLRILSISKMFMAGQTEIVAETV